MDVDKLFIAMGSFTAFIGVGLGAFGAHGLRGRLSEQMLAVWHTGIFYHMIHALGLILVGILIHLYSSPGSAGMSSLKLAGWLFLTGIILFSGSLYLLSGLDIRKLGMITPIGGLAFLAGWLIVVITMIRQ